MPARRNNMCKGTELWEGSALSFCRTAGDTLCLGGRLVSNRSDPSTCWELSTQPNDKREQGKAWPETSEEFMQQIF